MQYGVGFCSALRDLWSKVLSDIELMSTSQQEIGNHISKQIAQPIDSFVKRKLNKQVTILVLYFFLESSYFN